jgi:hypothetical protein
MNPKFIPINPQEHDNMIRSIAVAHMGMGQGNPTQWVISAMHEAYQKGFALGFSAAQRTTPNSPPMAASAPAIDRTPSLLRIDRKTINPDDVVEG